MWPSGASSSQRSISTKFCLIITGCGLCTGAKTAIYSCSVSVCGGCVDDLYGVVIIRFIWWMHTNHYSTKPTNLALGPHHYRCLLLLLAGHYICVCVCDSMSVLRPQYRVWVQRRGGCQQVKCWHSRRDDWWRSVSGLSTQHGRHQLWTMSWRLLPAVQRSTRLTACLPQYVPWYHTLLPRPRRH